MVPHVRPLRESLLSSTIGQVLLSPTKFFEDRPPAETLPLAAGVVVLFVVSLAVGFLLVGSMLAGSIDATVTMDNPDRPPEPICDRHADDPDSAFGQRCAEPETIERDAGTLVREAIHDYLWIALIGPLGLWFAGSVVLYAAGRFAGGTPSIRGTTAIAGWAALPEFFRLGIGLVGLWFVLRNVTITDPERGVAVLETAMAPLDPVLLVASLLTAGWQWILLSGGLAADAEIPWSAAAVGVGVPLGLVTLFGVL